VLVAVSGGVDSTVLLYSLYELRHYFGITLACASFDHKIRPSSHEDILFVGGLCKKFSLPFYTGQADAKDYAKRLKLNLEESARILRYNFLIGIGHRFRRPKNRPPLIIWTILPKILS
jgi:Predicted ATPase of the PP-loop superfamily implicated in cell cycle control